MKWLLKVLAIAVTAAPLSAQQELPNLWLIPHGDTVTVQLPQVPADFFGFHVYRGVVGGELERLTDAPVSPLRDPVLMVSALGEDVATLEDLTRSPTAFQMTRRIQSDPVIAAAYSYLFPSVADALARRYQDASVDVGVLYRYEVRFVDIEGQERGELLAGEVDVQDGLPPAPTELSGEAEETEVTLRWSYPSYLGDPSDVVVGFHLYRSDATGAAYERRTDAPVPRDAQRAAEWVDLEVRSGQSYVYVVRAVDLIGREGPPSDPLSLAATDPRPPSPPEAVVTIPGEGRVQVVWRVPPELDVVGYRIERSLGLDQPYAGLNEELVPVQEPAWIDDRVIGGTQYFYRVSTVDVEGRESEPSNPIAAVPFDNEPPPSPLDLSVAVVDRTLEVRWQPPADPAVMGYHVYRGEDVETLVRLTSEPMSGTAYVDTGFGDGGLVPGARYLVRVSALDSLLNESAPVEVELTVPDDVAPAAPTGLTVTNPLGRDMLLRWNAAPDLDVAYYVVARADGPGEALVQLDSVGTQGRLQYRDATVSTGATYAYQVFAVDQAANRGEPAEVVGTLGDRSPPPAPGFVEAAMSSTGVEVRWERIAAGDAQGYRVLRATRPTGVLEAVSPMIPVGAELRFVDVDGTPDHYYRVVAVDTSGNESEPTAPVRPGGRS